MSVPPPTTFTAVAAHASAPTRIDMRKFDPDDPRVHFSQADNAWRFEDDDGNEYEWDPKKESWVEVLDEDLIKKQQAAYSVAGVDENAPAAPVVARESKKRRVDYTSNTPDDGPAAKKGRRGRSGGDASLDRSAEDSKSGSRTPKPITAVYVTGLPADATLDELASTFGRYGVLMEDDEGQPKIKMYTDEKGNFKCEALVVYFKPESVDLAVRLLDETSLRLGDAEKTMRVQRAEFDKGKEEGGGNGTGKEARSKALAAAEKKRIQKRMGKMQSKLNDWDSDEDSLFADATSDNRYVDKGPSKTTRFPRVVVLKHMFRLEELEEDASLLLDLKEDVREECEKLGDVRNITLYDKEKDGVITVKFADELSAQACVAKMNGRFFGGQQVIAYIYDGKERFVRTGGASGLGGGDEENAEDEEKKRIEAFGDWLEGGGDDGGDEDRV